MKNILYAFQENIGISLQCKVGNSFGPADSALTYTEAAEIVRMFEYCYAGYLMAKSAGKHTAQVEMDLAAFVGISTWYSTGITQTSATFPIGLELHPMFTYPLGDPAEEIPHASWPATSYRVGAYTYARQFENGLVLINPYDPGGITPDVISRRRLSATNFDDTLELSDKMIDAANGQVLDQVTVAGGTAKFLLFSPTWSGRRRLTVAGADQQYVAYNRAMGLDDYGQVLHLPPPEPPSPPLPAPPGGSVVEASPPPPAGTAASPPPLLNPPSSPGAASGGMGIGAIIGIVVGVLLLAGAAVVGVIFMKKRQKKKVHATTTTQEGGPKSGPTSTVPPYGETGGRSEGDARYDT